jgi:NADPH:quinone reductase-like Zn-dependent oxidoreductase
LLIVHHELEAGAAHVVATEEEAAKKFIVEGLASGRLKPIIAKVFPLDEIVEAHRFLESNPQFGEIVVQV